MKQIRSGRFLQSVRAEFKSINATGTNGKTTTCAMVAAIFQSSGHGAALQSTVGSSLYLADDRSVSSHKSFASLIRHALKKGVRQCSVECSAKSLMQGYARIWPADVAVFTNLSRDHIRHHGGFENYLAAKAQLFMALKPGQTAVLNLDDPASELIRQVIAPGVQIRTYSLQSDDADLKASMIGQDTDGQTLLLSGEQIVESLGTELQLAVMGEHNVANALAAALATDSLGISASAIRDGLMGFPGVTGRLQFIAKKPLVIVDFAHTPDALMTVLRATRQLIPANSRLICVFGCGGGRDQQKRPQMGKVAAELADIVIITTDNPRSEKTQSIANQILNGIPKAVQQSNHLHLIDDRRQAIQKAIEQADKSDAVIITGKGHERTQIIGDQTLPFSDQDIAREIWRDLHV